MAARIRVGRDTPTAGHGTEPLVARAPGDAASAHAGVPLTLDIPELRRGRRRILGASTIEIPPGAIVALVGANGAGKSTLLMSLAGVLSRRDGVVQAHRCGMPLGSMGYAPQRPLLAPWLSVRRALELNGVDAERLLDHPSFAPLLPLLDHAAPALSGGQTQLLAVLAVLAGAHDLMLLDEPFAGIDLRHRAPLTHRVQRVRQIRPGAAVLISSHQPGDLYPLCDHVIAIANGRVSFAGPRALLPSVAAEPDGATDLQRFETRLAALIG